MPISLTEMKGFAEAAKEQAHTPYTSLKDRRDALAYTRKIEQTLADDGFPEVVPPLSAPAKDYFRSLVDTKKAFDKALLGPLEHSELPCIASLVLAGGALICGAAYNLPKPLVGIVTMTFGGLGVAGLAYLTPPSLPPSEKLLQELELCSNGFLPGLFD